MSHLWIIWTNYGPAPTLTFLSRHIYLSQHLQWNTGLTTCTELSVLRVVFCPGSSTSNLLIDVWRESLSLIWSICPWMSSIRSNILRWSWWTGLSVDRPKSIIEMNKGRIFLMLRMKNKYQANFSNHCKTKLSINAIFKKYYLPKLGSTCMYCCPLDCSHTAQHKCFKLWHNIHHATI